MTSIDENQGNEKHSLENIKDALNISIRKHIFEARQNLDKYKIDLMGLSRKTIHPMPITDFVAFSRMTPMAIIEQIFGLASFTQLVNDINTMYETLISLDQKNEKIFT